MAPVIIVAVNAIIVKELTLHPISIIDLRQLGFDPWSAFGSNLIRMASDSS